jgi:hypothetical protein
MNRRPVEPAQYKLAVDLWHEFRAHHARFQTKGWFVPRFVVMTPEEREAFTMLTGAGLTRHLGLHHTMIVLSPRDAFDYDGRDLGLKD